MTSRSRLLAAHLLKDLDPNDSINSALFAAAFSELDELREKIGKIPADINKSAENFNQVTTTAVDDFVSVANEALSKFMQRTREINEILNHVEKTASAMKPMTDLLLQNAQLIAAQANTEQEPQQAEGVSLPVVAGLCTGAALFGIFVTFFVMH